MDESLKEGKVEGECIQRSNNVSVSTHCQGRRRGHYLLSTYCRRSTKAEVTRHEDAGKFCDLEVDDHVEIRRASRPMICGRQSNSFERSMACMIAVPSYRRLNDGQV